MSLDRRKSSRDGSKDFSAHVLEKVSSWKFHPVLVMELRVFIKIDDFELYLLSKISLEILQYS